MGLFILNLIWHQRKLAQKEYERRLGCSKTYTEPMPNEDSYMIEFYKTTIFDNSNEMKSLLQEYPDTLNEHYQILVLSNTVPFGLFWARFYYRCNIESILKELMEKLNQEKTNSKTDDHPSLNLLPQIENEVFVSNLDFHKEDEKQMTDDPYYMAMFQAADNNTEQMTTTIHVESTLEEDETDKYHSNDNNYVGKQSPSKQSPSKLLTVVSSKCTNDILRPIVTINSSSIMVPDDDSPSDQKMMQKSRMIEFLS